MNEERQRRVAARAPTASVSPEIETEIPNWSSASAIAIDSLASSDATVAPLTMIVAIEAAAVGVGPRAAPAP